MMTSRRGRRRVVRNLELELWLRWAVELGMNTPPTLLVLNKTAFRAGSPANFITYIDTAWLDTKLLCFINDGCTRVANKVVLFGWNSLSNILEIFERERMCYDGIFVANNRSAQSCQLHIPASYFPFPPVKLAVMGSSVTLSPKWNSMRWKRQFLPGKIFQVQHKCTSVPISGLRHVAAVFSRNRK